MFVYTGSVRVKNGEHNHLPAEATLQRQVVLDTVDQIIGMRQHGGISFRKIFDTLEKRLCADVCRESLRRQIRYMGDRHMPRTREAMRLVDNLNFMEQGARHANSH